jgi:tripartite-type tricarboxylate transporter receptor subunit TctC
MHMCLTRRQALRSGLLALPPFSTTAQVWAGDWPRKPLRIIVPTGAGGAPDIRTRWFAQRLEPLLGQTILVDNRPGAGGTLAMAAAARSAPDGYTLVTVHTGTMAMSPFLYERPGYDPLKDFVMVTRTGVGPMALLVGAASDIHSLQDLRQLARAKPGELNFGSPGIGTPPHLACELFSRAAGVAALHVPFNNPPQVIVELMSGRLTWCMDTLLVAVPQVKGGRLRALAVTSPQRMPGLPDVPTMGQLGLPECEFTTWTGLAAPAGTPTPVIDRLYVEISKVAHSAEAKQWFAELGNEPGNESPQATATIVRADHDKWGALIKAAGIKLQ